MLVLSILSVFVTRLKFCAQEDYGIRRTVTDYMVFVNSHYNSPCYVNEMNLDDFKIPKNKYQAGVAFIACKDNLLDVLKRH